MLSDKTNALADISEGNKENSNNIISDSESNNNTKKKDSFALFNSQIEIVEALTNEEAGQLIKALYQYNNGEMPELTGSPQIAFITIRQQVDWAKEKYNAFCEKQKQNGLKGGRPKQEKPNQTQNNPTKPKENQKSLYDNDNDNDINNSNSKKIKNKIPTLEEIEAYCIERKNNVNAQKFYDYYASNDWKDSNGKPVLNWKQKLISTWEKNNNSFNKGGEEVETEPTWNPNL